MPCRAFHDLYLSLKQVSELGSAALLHFLFTLLLSALSFSLFFFTICSPFFFTTFLIFHRLQLPRQA